MVNISADGKSFELQIGDKDAKKKRIPVCYVDFVSRGDEFEDPKTLNLGKIDLSIKMDSPNFELKKGDLTLDNKVVRKEKEFDLEDVNFNPCLLDADGDGVVTKEDIDAIYSRPKIPRKFDLNGDGVVTEADRLLANEYIGTFCSSQDDTGPVLYDGVYDHIPDMKWGYSVNRLLRRGHSTKPLFRVYMAVNYFTNHDFSAPNAAPSKGYRFPQDRGGSSFIKEPLLKKIL